MSDWVINDWMGGWMDEWMDEKKKIENPAQHKVIYLLNSN